MKPREHVNEASALHNLAYQTRMYREEPKEADKVLLGFLSGLKGKLLDIGCYNGNLLKHIRVRYPGFTLTGGDLSPVRIDACKSDSDLIGIDFDVMDIMELPRNSYDVIVANAVLYAIPDFRGALKSVADALTASGTFIAFDFFHAFNQEITVIEESEELPEGHTIRMRSQSKARLILESLGMDVTFNPFSIGIDLPIDTGNVIRTHTVQTEAGRLQFRGAIFQPWCHLVSTKKHARR